MTKHLMSLRHEISRNAIAILSGIVLTYAAFNILFGNTSMLALHALQQREAQSVQELETLRANREGMEDRVTRLRTGTIDWDLVEQEALRQLGPQAVEGAKKL